MESNGILAIISLIANAVVIPMFGVFIMRMKSDVKQLDANTQIKIDNNRAEVEAKISPLQMMDRLITTIQEGQKQAVLEHQEQRILQREFIEAIKDNTKTTQAQAEMNKEQSEITKIYTEVIKDNSVMLGDFDMRIGEYMVKTFESFGEATKSTNALNEKLTKTMEELALIPSKVSEQVASQIVPMIEQVNVLGIQMTSIVGQFSSLEQSIIQAITQNKPDTLPIKPAIIDENSKEQGNET